jgi:DNA-binding MarR family transcriptional regulator
VDVLASQTIDADHLAAELSQAVTRLRRALQRAARANFDGESLSPTEVELLLLVAERPGIGVAVAAGELGAAPNTVSTLIRKLVSIGLLNREFSTGDRRVARLLLTDEAEARLARWRERRADVLTNSFDRLEQEHLARLVDAVPAMESLSAALYRPRRRARVNESTGGPTGPAPFRADDERQPRSQQPLEPEPVGRAVPIGTSGPLTPAVPYRPWRPAGFELANR